MSIAHYSQHLENYLGESPLELEQWSEITFQSDSPKGSVGLDGVGGPRAPQRQLSSPGMLPATLDHGSRSSLPSK